MSKNKNAVNNNCVVLYFEDSGLIGADPYLDTMEAAIKDCLEFNIGESGCYWEGKHDDDIRKIEDLMENGKYEQAWNLWEEVSWAFMTGCHRMDWHKLGNKKET